MQIIAATISKTFGATPGVDGRSRAHRQFKELHARFLGALESRGPVSPGNAALVDSLVALTVKIDAMNRAARRGEDVDAGDLMRLTGQQSRTLRMLGLATDLRENQPRRRLSPVARAEQERRAAEDAGEPDELELYCQQQREKLKTIAAMIGFDPVLFDDHAGGRLNELELCELLERGNERGARKLIRTAQAEYDEAQRLARADVRAACAADNDDYGDDIDNGRRLGHHAKATPMKRKGPPSTEKFVQLQSMRKEYLR